MNTFLKFNLTVCLMFIGLNLFAQTPRINGADWAAIQGLDSYGAYFTASGCPTTHTYEWSYNFNDFSRTGAILPLPEWSAAYGVGDGSETNKVTAYTVTLGSPPDWKKMYTYYVKCKKTSDGTLSAASARVDITMMNRNFVPSASKIAVACVSPYNENTGSVTLKATGCFEKSIWTTPNGSTQQVVGETLVANFADPKYTAGTYSVRCALNSLLNPDGSPAGEFISPSASIGIGKSYAVPNPITITGPSKEICKDEGSVLNWTNAPAGWQNKLSIQWFNGDRGAEVFNTKGQSTEQLIAYENGFYTLRIRSNDPSNCPSGESKTRILVNVIPLPKPVVTGNLNYCIEGSTTLKVSEIVIPCCSGFDGTKATTIAKYRWYVDGVEDPTLGNAASATLNKNVKLAVDYLSNFNCPSDKSVESIIKNFDRPTTPVITAKTPTGFCADKPIAAILESSSLLIGTTKWVWSNKDTTQTVKINKAGLYTVQVIDLNGCISLASAAIEIKVLPLPAAPVISVVNNASTVFCNKSDAGALNAVSLSAATTNEVIWSTTFEGKILADVRASGLYTAKARDNNGCISVASNAIKVTNQPNPALASDTKIVKEGVYNLKALNFLTVAEGNGIPNEYEWKTGTVVLKSTSNIAKVTIPGDYTVRRRYSYTIEGTFLKCITEPVKYTYTTDPEFKGIAIFPNPITNSIVNITTLEDWTGADVLLFDMVGRPVFAGKLGSTEEPNQLNVNGLGNGIYIIQVKSTGDRSYVGKVIVNR